MADDIQAVAAPSQQDPGAQVYDISGKEPVLGSMPHEQVQDALTSGKFSLPKGDVHVVSPDGVYGTLPAEQAPAAFKAGYQYATPTMLDTQAKHEQYSTPGQQIATAIEGGAKGLLGPLATGAERFIGVDPEDIKGREEENPWLSKGAEAATFVGSMLGGTGEAALLGKAGEAVGKGAEAIGVTNDVAKGAAKMATEMALLQTGDEASDYLKNAPMSVGGSLANIGMSSLIGGLTGGALTGVGKGISKILDNPEVKNLTDRMAVRMKGLDPAQAVQDEAESAYNSYKDMGQEIGGASGVKAAAIDNLVPEMTTEISGQRQSLKDAVTEMISKHPNFADELKPLEEKLAAEPTSAGGNFEDINSIKQQLGEWGRYDKDTVSIKERPFRDAARSLGSTFKDALEDTDVWGQAGDLQKTLNEAWSSAIDPVKNFQKKFMTKFGPNDYRVEPSKFVSYMRANNKATNLTTRQAMMGEFLDGIEKFQNATNKAYEAAGIESPHAPIGTGAMRESLAKQSMGAKMADFLYERGMSRAAGDAAGASIGSIAGHATGIPGAGFGAGYVGAKIGEHVLPTLLQPLMERMASGAAFSSALDTINAAMKGQNLITKTAGNVFKAGGMEALKNLVPDKKTTEKLDRQVATLSKDPQKLLADNNLNHYMPGHSQEQTALAGRTVQYLNSLKPQATQQNPLDTKQPPSALKMAQYNRQLAIAQQPLSIMSHIKDGTLQAQDVATLKVVSPVLYNQMSKELMSEMISHIEGDGKVPYTVRQSLSLFLGQPLDSTMTPAGIQAAQATHMLAPAPQPQGNAIGKGKGVASKLGKNNKSYETASQNAESDRSGRS